MVTAIKNKRSNTPDAVPLPADLEEGQLAINLADQTLFSKDSEGDVIQLGIPISEWGNKVDKVTTPNIIYGTDGSGVQTTLPYPSSGTAAGVTGSVQINNNGEFSSASSFRWDAASTSLRAGALWLGAGNGDITTVSATPMLIRPANGINSGAAPTLTVSSGNNTSTGAGGALNVTAGTSSTSIGGVGTFAGGASTSGTGGAGVIAGGAGVTGGQVYVRAGASSAGQVGANCNYVTGNTSGVSGAHVFTTITNSVQTERFRVHGSGAISFDDEGEGVGNTGQVLTSQGPDSPPTWTTPSGAGIPTPGAAGTILTSDGPSEIPVWAAAPSGALPTPGAIGTVLTSAGPGETPTWEVSSGGGGGYADLHAFCPGTPAEFQVIFLYVATRAFTIPENLVGSFGKALSGSGGLATFMFSINDVNTADISFDTSADAVFTALVPGDIVVAPGDRLAIQYITSPADFNLYDVSIGILGNYN